MGRYFTGSVTGNRGRTGEGLDMIWFRSKVDWWIGGTLCVPPIVAVVVCVNFMVNGRINELPWAIGGVLFVALLYFGLVVPIRYGLGEHCLEINFGLCHSRIDYASISYVTPTRNPLSAPALSLDRLEVGYGGGVFGMALISPADREHFLKELAARSGLKEADRGLIRESRNPGDSNASI